MNTPYNENSVYIGKRYENIIIDAVNFFYRICGNSTKIETPIEISQKYVYLESIKKFINAVEEIKSKYGHADCEVYLLFDNYYSRADLASAFLYADRKELDEAYKSTRKKENRAFYTSLNFIRYYYLIGSSKYHTIRIDGLEADDLVPPLILEGSCKDKDNLLVTTDLDWCRYLSEKTDWLPKLNENPHNKDDVSLKLGFKLTTNNLIIYKALFGDESDNIKGLITENEKNFNDFKSIIEMVENPFDLISLCRKEELYEEHPILKSLNKGQYTSGKKLTYEKQYIINVQLVSAIPCSLESLESHLTSGRNAETLYKTVREAIGLDESNYGGFTFGNIKRPRVK